MHGRALLERRIEMLRDLGLGGKPALIFSELSQKHGVSEAALYKDWERRDQWVQDASGIKTGEVATFEIIASLRWLLSQASLEILKADNSSARVGAIRAAESLLAHIFEILQSTGKIEKVPEKLQAEIRQIIVKMWKPTEEEPAKLPSERE